MFIHSSVDGHLNFLQVLTIISKAAFNIDVQVFIIFCGHMFSFILSKFLGVELLCHKQFFKEATLIFHSHWQHVYEGTNCCTTWLTFGTAVPFWPGLYCIWRCMKYSTESFNSWMGYVLTYFLMMWAVCSTTPYFISIVFLVISVHLFFVFAVKIMVQSSQCISQWYSITL